MRDPNFLRFLLPCLLLNAAIVGLVAPDADAEVVSFSGTVTYSGSHAADSLFVAVMDTNTAGDDPTFLAVGAFAVGSPPYSQPFDLSFDNALATGPVIMAAALDVDGGGFETIGGGDIVGWYDGTADPVLISSATSQANLDFWLPLAEISGTVTFGPGQTNASVNAKLDAQCQGDSFQPRVHMAAAGAYTILGLYPGTYCVHGEGQNMSIGWISICYGDPECLNPTMVSLTTSQIVTGVDLDFSVITPNEQSTWGAVKSAYR